jgi:DNA-binding transcriptional regulator YdaS (Cro superfamily)
MEALERAIGLFGSQAALAAQLNLRQSHISMWKHRKSVPAEYCPLIERATGGAVRCEDLRPDVAWGVLREQAVPQEHTHN